MGRKLGHLVQFIRWGLLMGVTSILALGVDAPPAAADELNDWGYDSQTRSLTFTLPNNISPSVSVLAPDQLLLALPNTQVGDVAGLTVGDGVVDSIVLEQSSPDTLWVVMEFAEGTVLANEQRVVPVENGSSAGASQQWEVRPVVAASSRTMPVPIAADEIPAVTGSADSLRVPAVDVAQADFPELPILEPGISLNQPVIVPPVNESAPSPPANTAEVPPVPPAPPTVEANAEASRPAVSVPDLPEISIPVEVVSGDEADEASAIANIPDEPPFIGEFEVPVIDERAIAGEDIAEDTSQEAVAAEAVVEEAVVREETEAEVAQSESEAVVAAENEPTVEADVVPGDAVAAVPSVQPRVDASFAVEPVPNADSTVNDFEPEQLDLSTPRVTPQNIERWPEPIPFGAPLPQ